ncbi:MAG: hypothetical protein P8X58_07960 [Syntrophobacterales bacterium]
MRHKFILLMLVAVLLAGCTYHYKDIPTDIAPTAKGDQRYSTHLALLFTPKLLENVVSARPPANHGGQHVYYYRLGPALQTALTKSVKAAYADTTVVKVLPRPREFDRIISIDLEYADVRVDFIPGYLRQDAQATAAIAVIMDIIDGASLRIVRRMPVQGRGSSLKDASGFVPYAPMQFIKAIEDATQQLSEIVSNLLISGGAGPGRKL